MYVHAHALIARTWLLPLDAPAGLSLWERVLLARGKGDAAAREAMLNPAPVDPFAFRDMKTAVELVHRTVSAGGRIVVFGDYDADGLTATAILLRLFRQLGADVSWLIPDRLDEGYGIGAGHVDKLLESLPALVITVDCGSNSGAEVAALKTAGIRVIVTDHHVVDDRPEAADAHLNPRDEAAVEDLLSGAGVAFCLADAYLGTYGADAAEPLRHTLGVLAAVGTIADIMPLTGANRALVKAGLTAFPHAAPPGLRLLVQTGRPLDASTIAFAVAPALNAASRLGEAETALELLLADDEQAAARLAGRLTALNERRRALEAVITAEAVAQATLQAGQAEVLVVRGETWHTGVLGIVAARLVERFGKPAIVLNLDGGEWQGSARSLPSFDIHAALSRQAHLLARFGGHRRAAGLAVPDDRYDAFVAALQQAADTTTRTPPPLAVDAILLPSDLTETELGRLQRLEPCGEANPEPTAAAPGCRIVSLRVLQEKHCRLEVDYRGQRLTAMFFRRADLGDYYAPGDLVDLAGRPVWHTFRQQAYAQLLLTDIRPAATGDPAFDCPLEPDLFPEALATHPPDAGLFERVYRQLHESAGYEERLISPVLFAKRLGRAYNRLYSGLAVAAALRVLAEAGMLRLGPAEAGHLPVRLEKNPRRAALSDTATWQLLSAKGWLKS